MRGRKEQNEFIIGAKINASVSVCFLRFLFFFFLFPSFIYGFEMKSDTAKKYELNDPRNPDCPCHKYQKIAEEEYRKVHNIKNDQQFKSTKADTLHSARPYSVALPQRTSKKERSQMYFKKRGKKISTERKRIFRSLQNRKKIKKKKKIRKTHDVYAVCFKWR